MSAGKLVRVLTEFAKKGEVWRVHHFRKGRFTVRLLQDVKLDGSDQMFGAIIESGSAKYINESDRNVGDHVEMRTKMMEFEELVT